MRLFLASLFATLVALFWVDELCTRAHAAVNKYGDDVQMCSGRPWIDVTCNNADPTGVVDSTAAINNTFNTAITNGWPVFFPPGTFKVTSGILINFQGQAANGLNVISNGAILDGRTIASGNVLQFFCSGGTPAAPAVCNGLQLAGQLTVLGNTTSYVVVFGQTNFSDRLHGARVEHLIATNTSTGGAIQANYLTAGNLWLSGSTAGGNSSVGAVALEQVQTSKVAGWGSAAGASAPALLVETGSSVGNSFVGFAYDPNTNTCVSVPSATAMRNTWVSPYFPCTTAVSAPNGPNQNVLIGPSFAGTNMGPTSIGFTMVGRGSLSRFSAPTTASLTLAGVDDGTMFSSANGTGPLTQFTAASLPVILPNPASVGVGWTAGFITDNGKAVVLTVSAGKILAGDRQFTTMTVGASGTTGFETAVLESDGTNFRMVHLSQATALLNGMQSSFSARWVYPGGPGYQTTLGDNGNVVSSSATSGGLAVTLPSTTAVSPGWMVALSSSNAKAISVQVNGTAGGSIGGFGTGINSSITLAPSSTTWIQFDGSIFWVVNSNVPPPGAAVIDGKITSMTGDGSTFSVITQSGMSAQTIYNQSVNSGNPTLFNSFDAIRGVTVAPANSTVNTITGVAGYTINNTVPIGQRSQTIALFGDAVCAVNGSNCWGVDTIVSDNPSIGNTGVTAGTGKFLFNEFDLNITSPNTGGANLQVGGTAWPTNVTLPVNAISVNKLWGAGGQGTGTAFYANAFITADGCCINGLNLGASATGGSLVNSQVLALNYYDYLGHLQNMTMTAAPHTVDTGATLFFGGTGAEDDILEITGSLFLPNPGQIAFGGHGVVLTTPGLATICNDVVWSVCNVGAVGTRVSVIGTLNLTNATTGTPVASLCIDVSGNVIKKTTTGPCI